MSRKRLVDLDSDDPIPCIANSSLHPAKPRPLSKPLERLREIRIAQHSAKSQEHYTPHAITEAARLLMGGIDLDPAACWLSHAAPAWYGYQRDGTMTDGLAVTWSGKVWLNPPGGRVSTVRSDLSGVITDSYACVWWGKLLAEYRAGRVEQACFLAFSLEAFRHTQAIEPMTNYPFVVFRDRIRFWYPSDLDDKGRPDISAEDITGNPVSLIEGSSPTNANALVWLPPRGPDFELLDASFREAFAPFGAVVIPS